MVAKARLIRVWAAAIEIAMSRCTKRNGGRQDLRRHGSERVRRDQRGQRRECSFLALRVDLSGRASGNSLNRHGASWCLALGGR